MKFRATYKLKYGSLERTVESRLEAELISFDMEADGIENELVSLVLIKREATQ